MKIINQNILNVSEGIITHSVNCMGVMGSGLARQIRNKWPIVYEKYRHKFDHGKWSLGDVQQVLISGSVARGDALFVCNLAGQYTYGRDRQHTDYQAIETGLVALCNNWSKDYFPQVYIPWNMGCGLGGGDFAIVSKIIDKTIPTAIICKLE